MSIIAPRRNEPIISPGGYPTTRFSEYVEQSVSVVNDTETSVINNDAALNDFEFIEFWRS